MRHLWPVLDFIAADRAEDGPWQMAIDEALLAHRSRATLRAYQWKANQVSFGYFTDVAEVRRAFPGLPLTRRWTGGGAVEHGEDLTFSLVWPRPSLPTCDCAAEVYPLVHAALRAALLTLDVETSLTPPHSAPTPGAFCFQAPVPHDLLLGQEKVAGGALRRTRLAWLYQGSVRLPGKDLAPEAFFSALAGQLAAEVRAGALTPAEEALAQQLITTKYGTPEWLSERPGKKTTISRGATIDGD